MNEGATSLRDALADTFEQKCERNSRVQSRYDELMREGKHGHYETMFRVVREEVEAARATLRATSAVDQPARIQRLKDAIEGECDGLAIDDTHATAILQYVDGESSV